MKRLQRAEGSQYRDIDNARDAARIHFSPTPIGAGLFLRLTSSKPLPISRYWLPSIPPKAITAPFGLVFAKAHWLAVENSVAVLQSSLLVIRQKFRLLFLKIFEMTGSKRLHYIHTF
jgi:hypothetical protein